MQQLPATPNLFWRFFGYRPYVGEVCIVFFFFFLFFLLVNVRIGRMGNDRGSEGKVRGESLSQQFGKPGLHDETLCHAYIQQAHKHTVRCHQERSCFKRVFPFNDFVYEHKKATRRVQTLFAYKTESKKNCVYNQKKSYLFVCVMTKGFRSVCVCVEQELMCDFVQRRRRSEKRKVIQENIHPIHPSLHSIILPFFYSFLFISSKGAYISFIRSFAPLKQEAKSSNTSDQGSGAGEAVGRSSVLTRAVWSD